MALIKLLSSDGEVIQVDFDIAKVSVTIKNMVENLGLKEIFPTHVNAGILTKVIQWATYHKDDPPPTDDVEGREKRTDDLSSWDADFLGMDPESLFQLLLASSYLDIKGLLDVTSKTVANIIKGKTPEEIRKTFNIKNDLTAVEEDQLRYETDWCE